MTLDWSKPHWKNVPPDIGMYQGFVYVITNLDSGRQYIGKKFFWSAKTMPPLKGRKNKRRMQVESNWRDYWGSNAELLADIQRLGTSRFDRTMLMWCKTKWECAYHETRLQFNGSVLLFPDKYYNGIINCRLKRLEP